jgi:regulator of cell morphogenesis and NO signaling
MAIYKAFECEKFFPKEDLQSFPLRTIIEYLIKTHVYYINQKLPKLEKLLDALISNYGNSELMLFKLKDFFTEYKKNLMAHIQTEEVNLFPYILKLINGVDHVTFPHSLYLTMPTMSWKNLADGCAISRQ